MPNLLNPANDPNVDAAIRWAIKKGLLGVHALQQDLDSPEGMGNMARSGAAGLLGLAGDIESVMPPMADAPINAPFTSGFVPVGGGLLTSPGRNRFPPDKQQMLPTTEETAELLGADLTRPGGLLGLIGQPDPWDFGRVSMAVGPIAKIGRKGGKKSKVGGLLGGSKVESHITVTENTNPKLITRYYTQPHWSGNPESTHLEFNSKTKKYRFFNQKDELPSGESGRSLPYIGTTYEGKQLLNYKRETELVHVDDLIAMRGNKLNTGGKSVERLKKEIESAGGLREPVLIQVGKESRTAQVGEGNHRAQAAKELGYEYVPARVMVQRGTHGSMPAAKRDDIIPTADEYFKSDAKPSEVLGNVRVKPADDTPTSGGLLGGNYSGPAYRVEPGFEGGAPHGATAQDVVIEEMERKGIHTLDEFGLDEKTYDALKDAPADDLVWVGRSQDELIEAYGPQKNGEHTYGGLFGGDPEDISDVSDAVRGGRIIYEDGDGVLVLKSQGQGLLGTRVADDNLARAVAPDPALDPAVHRSLRAKEFTPKSTKTGIKEFRKNLDDARSRMTPRDAAQVDPLPDDFAGKVYMTDDGMVGFTMTDDGYIGHLYKDPDAGVAGVMESALIKARAEGGKNLEAFDTYLAKGYQKRGAVETGRFPYDADQATPEIQAALGATKPSFVQMDIGGYVPERKHSLLAGPRPQEALERYVPPRGEPKRVAEAMKGGRVNRLNRTAQKGLLDNADKWYHTGGVKDRFIEAWDGDVEKGSQMFDKFMDYKAALSPRSKVDVNLKRASVLYQRDLQGLPVTPLTNEMFPPGYGHLATTTAHAPGVKRLAETGLIGNPIDQPKVSSYAENLKGNYQPLTVDTHNNLLATGRNASPTKAEYVFLEERQKELAKRMGLDPAEYQAALWVGGEDITGVHNTQNMTAAVNQRIAKTAEELDVSEAEAFKMFARGDEYLRTVLLMIGAGALGAGATAGYVGDSDAT